MISFILFQGFNGLFVRLVSNAFGSMHQISSRFALQKFCAQWLRDAKAKEGPVKAAISDIFKGTFVFSFSSVAACLLQLSHFLENRHFLPMGEQLFVADVTTSKVEESVLVGNTFTADECKAFARARVRDIVLHSLAYQRRKNTCSYVARFHDHGDVIRGQIVHFVVCGNVPFAYIQKFCTIEENITEHDRPSNVILKKLWEQRSYGSFFKTVTLSNDYELAPLGSFQCLCIVIRIGETTYLTDVAHKFEHN